MHQPHFTPQKHYYFYVSGTHLCWRLSKPQGLVQTKGLGKFYKFTSSGIEPATFQFVAYVRVNIKIYQIQYYLLLCINVRDAHQPNIQ
jgi:hypothetical protein